MYHTLNLNCTARDENFQKSFRKDYNRVIFREIKGLRFPASRESRRKAIYLDWSGLHGDTEIKMTEKHIEKESWETWERKK